MAYKRFISKKGKQHGPYYYQNVRDNEGKVKSVYIGKKKGIHHIVREKGKGPFKAVIFILLVLLALILSLFFLQNRNISLSKKAIGQASVPFDVDQILLKVLVKSGESISKELRVMNVAQKDITAKIGFSGIRDIAYVEEPEFSIKPGQTKIVPISFASSNPEEGIIHEPGVYVGKVTISSGSYTKELPVIVEIETKNVLFDSNLNPVSRDREIVRGSEVAVEIRLFNLQGVEASSVGMEYEVSDINNNRIISESESAIVQTQASFFKTIRIPENIKPGNYIFSSKAVYGNSVGTSSFLFEVTVGPKSFWLTPVSFIAFCRNDPLCWTLSMIVILLVFTIGAYMYFFLGAYIYNKLFGRGIFRKRGIEPPVLAAEEEKHESFWAQLMKNMERIRERKRREKAERLRGKLRLRAEKQKLKLRLKEEKMRLREERRRESIRGKEHLIKLREQQRLQRIKEAENQKKGEEISRKKAEEEKEKYQLKKEQERKDLIAKRAAERKEALKKFLEMFVPTKEYLLKRRVEREKRRLEKQKAREEKIMREEQKKREIFELKKAESLAIIKAKQEERRSKAAARARLRYERRKRIREFFNRLTRKPVKKKEHKPTIIAEFFREWSKRKQKAREERQRSLIKIRKEKMELEAEKQRLDLALKEEKKKLTEKNRRKLAINRFFRRLNSDISSAVKSWKKQREIALQQRIKLKILKEKEKKLMQEKALKDAQKRREEIERQRIEQAKQKKAEEEKIEKQRLEAEMEPNRKKYEAEKSRHIEKCSYLLKKGYSAIEKGKVAKARRIHTKLMHSYLNISGKERDDIHGQVSEFYSHLKSMEMSAAKQETKKAEEENLQKAAIKKTQAEKENQRKKQIEMQRKEEEQRAAIEKKRKEELERAEKDALKKKKERQNENKKRREEINRIEIHLFSLGNEIKSQKEALEKARQDKDSIQRAIEGKNAELEKADADSGGKAAEYGTKKEMKLELKKSHSHNVGDLDRQYKDKISRRGQIAKDIAELRKKEEKELQEELDAEGLEGQERAHIEKWKKLQIKAKLKIEYANRERDCKKQEQEILERKKHLEMEYLGKIREINKILGEKRPENAKKNADRKKAGILANIKHLEKKYSLKEKEMKKAEAAISKKSDEMLLLHNRIADARGRLGFFERIMMPKLSMPAMKVAHEKPGKEKPEHEEKAKKHGHLAPKHEKPEEKTMQSDSAQKESRAAKDAKGSRALAKCRALIRESGKYFDLKDAEKAERLYHKARKSYIKLEYHEKKDVYESLMELYKKLAGNKNA